MRWSGLATLVLLLATAAGLALIGLRGGKAGGGTGPVVLVSGRDDRGLLREQPVRLYREPGSAAIAGQVDDGRLARVVEARGQWLRVRALGEPRAEGWLDDFYLRDRAIRRDGGQVELADAALEGDALKIAVRPVGDRRGPLTWLDPAQLREVGARDDAR
jgi:hypothetical protein